MGTIYDLDNRIPSSSYNGVFVFYTCLVRIHLDMFVSNVVLYRSFLIMQNVYSVAIVILY